MIYVDVISDVQLLLFCVDLHSEQHYCDAR